MSVWWLWTDDSWPQCFIKLMCCQVWSPTAIPVTSNLYCCRFPKRSTGQLWCGVLPGRYPPDLWRSPTLSDSLGGGQTQEEGERGVPEKGPRRQWEDVGTREASGRITVQNWRVGPLRALMTHGLRLRLLHTEYICFSQDYSDCLLQEGVRKCQSDETYRIHVIGWSTI